MQQIIDSILLASRQGQHAEALRLSRTLAQSFPADEGVRSLLAVSEQNAGDLDVAHELLLSLTQEFPGTWQHWMNLGNVRRLRGELAAAGEAYRKALAINPGSARLQANLGLLHLNLGEFPQAREHLCAACMSEGAEPGMRVWAAVACQASADDEGALALLQGWREWPALSEEATLELGWLLIVLGDPESGERILANEFQNANLRVRALARRVLAMERHNRLTEAAALTTRMHDPAQIADRQARMETLQALAIVAARLQRPDQARTWLEQALSLDLPARYRQPLLFSLARACDALGDVDGAMAALADAHAGDLGNGIRQAPDLRETGLLALADAQFDLQTPLQWSAEAAPSENESPVFVVGFPRSGTTLLEQMLSAHPAFVSVDEKPMVQRVLEQLRKQSLPYPEGLAGLSPTQRAALRECYWKEARRWADPQPGVRLVDKHPLNFLALPLIRCLFPEAPVILCRRHPCDSLLSSYMQNFRDPRLAAECASLERLAGLYVRLAARWAADSSRFPERILISRHEDLLQDTDLQLQRLGEFLGIDDTAAMRNYREHAQARGFIGTPSYAQVVQALHSDSAGRWKRYLRHLEPVLPVLAPIMEDWGYDDAR